ncbi:hypothetical protein DL96DRAFT_1019451 [Flagelloscypha sp. PMI_526]|nr:hypothetical protein DL96DRAFT_1019451 [Flagelloscypha sp. PMI_526]
MATATANASTPVIGDATRIWEAGIHWTLRSQCCVWDQATRRVHVWECIVEHDAVPGTSPPNTNYWRHLARR